MVHVISADNEIKADNRHWTNTCQHGQNLLCTLTLPNCPPGCIYVLSYLSFYVSFFNLRVCINNNVVQREIQKFDRVNTFVKLEVHCSLTEHCSLTDSYLNFFLVFSKKLCSIGKHSPKFQF